MFKFSRLVVGQFLPLISVSFLLLYLLVGLSVFSKGLAGHSAVFIRLLLSHLLVSLILALLTIFTLLGVSGSELSFDALEVLLGLLFDFLLLFLVVNPLGLGTTLDLVLIFDHVICSLGFTERSLHLSILLKFKVNFSEQRVHLVGDELVA